MGIIKGSISYSKFFVSGELPDDFRDRFIERIALHAFQPLTVEGEEVQSMGWVPISRTHDDEVHFDHNDVFYNQYINLGLRIDTWRFPSQVLKSELDEATRKHLKDRQREKLTRREKEELKIAVSKKLRKKFRPVTKVIDFSWNFDTSTARFWNQSLKNHELLVEQFEKTFPSKLTLLSPYTVAAHAGLPESILADIASVEAAVFQLVAA